MLSIKHFKKEREIVRACGAQSKIFDRSYLLLESDAQVLFLKRLLPAKFNDAGALGAFFLLFHDRPPCLLLIFWSDNVDALRCDLTSEDHGAQREEDAVSHVRSLLKYLAMSRESDLG